MAVATVHHRFDGPEDAPVLVLGPPLGAELEVWDPQIPELARTWRVLRYDPRGQRRSELADGTRSIGDLAGDVLALADSYGIDRFAVGGLSLGGAIALWIAVHEGARVDALVLCSTSAYFGEPGPWLDRARVARTEGPAALADMVVSRWFTPEYAAANPDVVAPVRDMVRATPPEGYAACCDALSTHDLRGELGKVSARTIVVGAEQDPSTPPEHARALAAGIPGAELHILPVGAHLVNIERPDAVTPLLTSFLAR